MARGTNATNEPIQANRSPMPFMKTPMTPERCFLPDAYSAIIRGILQRKRKITHAIRNAPAPVSPVFWAAILGNLQMLPVPTAIPRALIISPIRVVNLCSVEPSGDFDILNLFTGNYLVLKDKIFLF